MPNTVKTKQDIVIALENAVKALKDCIEPVDNANGFLNELDEIDQSQLSEDSIKRLESVREFYMQFPVYSTIEDEIDQLEEVLGELYKPTLTASAQLLEEMTEESAD